MKKAMCVVLLLSLLLLCGCSAHPVPSESWDVYVFATEEAHQLAVDGRGEVVMEVDRGQLTPLLDRDGRAGALAVRRQVGEEERLDIYDLKGKPVLTDLKAHHGQVWGGLLRVYGVDGECLYRLSDGQCLVELASAIYDLGERIFVRPTGYRGGQLLDQNGQLVMDLGPETGAIRGYGWNEDSPYIGTSSDEGVGLLDLDGNVVLEPVYEEIRDFEGTKILAVCRDGVTQVIETETGESKSLPREYTQLLLGPKGLTGHLWSDMNEEIYDVYLLNEKGEMIVEQGFDNARWVDVDGGFYVCIFRVNDRHYAAAIDPDGTVRWQFERPGTRLHFSGPWAWAADPSKGRGEVTYYRIDLKTGEVSPIHSQPCDRGGPLTNEGDVPYLCLVDRDGLGGEKIRVVAVEDGHVVAENLQEVRYAGGGVFQCRQGDVQGLMKLDGSWLYKEEIAP